MTDIRRPSHDIRRVAGIGMGIIIVTFGVIGLWAALAPLSSAVIGHGIVAYESNRQTITHYDGGIVRQIFVHEGDHVKAGQTLVDLNPVQADATLESTRVELFSLLARSDRLKAELANQPVVTYSAEVVAESSNPAVAGEINDQNQQFRDRRATLNDQIAVLQARISEYKTEIEGIEEQRASLQQQAGLLDSEMSGLSELYQKDLVPKPRILELQRQRAQLEGQIGGSITDQAKAEKSIGETELQINQVRQEFYQEASKELSDDQVQIGDLQQRFAVAQDAAQRVSITAPMDGVVQDLKVFTVGGVVRPGEPLMEIAPDRGHMIIEARFSPNDVDSVHQNQTVQIRFSTFHSRTIPVINGVIRSVSQDRLSDEATHAPYYLAVVDVSELHLPPELNGKLKPGLPAEIVATTGSRTALQYAFGPLSNAITGTMRER